MALRNLGILFAITLFSSQHAAWAAQESVQSTTSEASFRSGVTNVYAQLSLAQFQDSFFLNSGGTRSRILEEPTGICPGFGLRRSLSPELAWDVNTCAFIGSAEAEVDGTTSTASTYYSKNNFVLGLESAGGILWSPGGIKHQLGIEVPVLLRHTGLQDPGVGSSFSSTTAVQTGIQIESRFYSANKLCFDPKVAWFQTSHTILWTVNFALDIL